MPAIPLHGHHGPPGEESRGRGEQVDKDRQLNALTVGLNHLFEIFCMAEKNRRQDAEAEREGVFKPNSCSKLISN